MLSKLFWVGGGKGGGRGSSPLEGGEKPQTKKATKKVTVPLEENGQLRNFLEKLWYLLPKLWIKILLNCSWRKVNGKLCSSHVSWRNWICCWRGTFFFSVQAEWVLDSFKLVGEAAILLDFLINTLLDIKEEILLGLKELNNICLVCPLLKAKWLPSPLLGQVMFIGHKEAPAKYKTNLLSRAEE